MGASTNGTIRNAFRTPIQQEYISPPHKKLVIPAYQAPPTHPRHSRAGGPPVPRRDKRHSRAGGNQVPRRDKRHSHAGGNQVPRRDKHTRRHSRAGGNPVPPAGTNTHSLVIPAHQAPLPLVIAHAARCMLAMTRVFNKQRISEFFLLLFFFKCSKF